VDLSEISPLEGEEDDFEVKPGLDSYGDEPSAALPALAAMLKASQRYIPKAVWSESLLFLKATAGMRLMERKKAETVMTVVKKFLSNEDNNPYKFVSAEIISGEEEAIFSYLTTNYNVGSLATPSKTVGAMEIGGASMQVVFKPEDDIQDNEFQFYLNGDRQSVYAKSYLRFGIDEVLKRMMAGLVRRSPDKVDVESPCHNPGLKEEFELDGGKKHSFVGTGNATACAEAVRSVMGLDIECLVSPCAIFGAYMPPVQGNFYAFAGMFYAAHGLGLVGWKDAKVLTPDQIADATASFCPKDLAYAQKESGQPMKYAKTFCFMGTYVHQILLAFGFQDSQASVTFTRKQKGSNLDWATGGMLYESHLMPLSLKSEGESVRGLCGTPALFGKPPSTKGATERPRAALLGVGIAFLMLHMFG